MKIPFPVVVAFCLATSCSFGATISTYDIIDKAFNSTSGLYTGAGSYDFFNATTGLSAGDVGFTPDGQMDIQVVLTTTGTGTKNGVTYTSNIETSATGIASNLVASKTPTVVNSGNRVTNVVDILFLAGTNVTAANVSGFTWNSANSQSVVWEFSYLQYLDANFQPIGLTPVIDSYLNQPSLQGQYSNSLVAASTGSVLNVGTLTTAQGTPGSYTNASTAYDTPLELGISASTIIGGVRFVHFIEDVRGTSNTTSTVSATLTKLALTNFTVQAVPEPSKAMLILFGLMMTFGARRVR